MSCLLVGNIAGEISFVNVNVVSIVANAGLSIEDRHCQLVWSYQLLGITKLNAYCNK